MNNKDLNARQAIERIKKVYKNMEKVLDSLPDAFPKSMKNQIKDLVFDDEDLSKLMSELDHHRPPKIFLIGRTGVGKSSLINAISGKYLAPVNDVYAHTKFANKYDYVDNGKVLMEILDTRGIAESIAIDNKISAEDMIKKEVNTFLPDVCIFMLNASHRDDINSDVDFLREISEDYRKNNGVDLPIITVINKVDELAPSRFKDPKEYPISKNNNINEVIKYYGQIIMEGGLEVNEILPASSLIEWQIGGEFIDTLAINDLPPAKLEELEIGFDGRYGIEKLLDALENSIEDYDALIGLKIACRMENILINLTDKLIKIFAGFAGTIALTPIPVADVYPLIAIQILLVSLIAGLGGRDVSAKSAREFLVSIGAVGVTGNIFRLTAQQILKFVPGAGSAISASIAAFGTKTIGDAAKKYYIEGIDIKKVSKDYKKKIKEEKKKS